MTVRYVGAGGSDSNNGTSWATRKLTLNGAEDTPVTPGDIVYVAPGVYRELLTIDVNGGSGSPITYVGDVTGEHTDGVGGIVRITGGDNDASSDTQRLYGVYSTGGKQYRTFRGLKFDLFANGSTQPICFENGTNTGIIVEDCIFRDLHDYSIYITSPRTCTARRNLVISSEYGIRFYASAFEDSVGSIIENNIFMGIGQRASDPCIQLSAIGGTHIRHNTFFAVNNGAIFVTGDVSSKPNYVYNNIFSSCNVALYSAGSGCVVEDYNNFWDVATERNGVSVGTNSGSLCPLFGIGEVSSSGIRMIESLFGLSEWSPLAMKSGSTTGSAVTQDFFGITRPTTASKKSWGAIQYYSPQRETTTTYSTSAASLKLADASRVQFRVPVTAVSTAVSVYAYRETNYAGTAPQMIIRQPGQADRITTDVGGATSWNQLTDTFTPSGSPCFIIVELVSNNTATSGDYDTFFDNLTIT